MADVDFLKYKALLFVFPGAVLAATIDGYLGDSFLSIFVFTLVFLFIPVEAYSSHLWEQVNTHRKTTSYLDYVQDITLVVIDLIRVAFLTLAVAQFPKVGGSPPSGPAATNLIVFLSVFLVFNFLWNMVARPLEAGIKTIFDVRLEQIRATDRKVEKAVAVATKALLALNRLAFFYFFPVAAIVMLIAYSVSLLVQTEAGHPHLLGAALRSHYVGLFSGFLMVQIVLKLTQIAVIRVVLSMDTAYQDPDATHAGLISQVAAQTKYSVFVVSANSSTPQKTNFELTHLMTARMQLYMRDRRRHYVDVEHLVFDPAWDQISAHLVYVDEERILGMIRVTPSVNGRLPISEAFAHLKFHERAYELSRMTVDDRRRADASSSIAAKLFVGCADYLLPHSPECIVIDAITGTTCVIKETTYARMGFAPQNLRYRDRRYAADSVVLMASRPDEIDQFFSWARRMRSRLARKDAPATRRD